mmetsp:Transcript_39125/g.91139  ORF Transcript_39125/g.91139 Transcript_39125/m.91139 type:complete len:226 (-) Transcript_39125:2703-3380(-)
MRPGGDSGGKDQGVSATGGLRPDRVHAERTVLQLRGQNSGIASEKHGPELLSEAAHRHPLRSEAHPGNTVPSKGPQDAGGLQRHGHPVRLAHVLHRLHLRRGPPPSPQRHQNSAGVAGLPRAEDARPGLAHDPPEQGGGQNSEGMATIQSTGQVPSSRFSGGQKAGGGPARSGGRHAPLRGVLGPQRKTAVAGQSSERQEICAQQSGRYHLQHADGHPERPKPGF